MLCIYSAKCDVIDNVVVVVTAADSTLDLHVSVSKGSRGEAIGDVWLNVFVVTYTAALSSS